MEDFINHKEMFPVLKHLQFSLLIIVFIKIVQCVSLWEF